MKRALLIVATAFIAVISSAQGSQHNNQPVVIAVLVDFTGSVSDWSTEPVSTQNISALFDLIDKSGGEVGVGTITENHRAYLRRLRLPPPAPELERPDQNTDVFTRRRRLREWKKNLSKYEATERERRVENRSKIDSFFVELDSLLAMKPDRPATDLWGAVARSTGFLSEDPHYWVSTSGQKPSRHILIVSDGRNTVESSPSAKIPSDITIAVVSGVSGLGDLDDLGRGRIKTFENPKAAVFYIISVAEEGK